MAALNIGVYSMSFSELKPGDTVFIHGAEVTVSKVRFSMQTEYKSSDTEWQLGYSITTSAASANVTELEVVYNPTGERPWMSTNLAVAAGNEAKRFQLVSITRSGDIVTLALRAVEPTDAVVGFDPATSKPTDKFAALVWELEHNPDPEMRVAAAEAMGKLFDPAP